MVLALGGIFILWRVFTPAVPEKATDPASEHRFEAARAAAARVVKGLNDPASLQWDDLFANSDGSVVCAVFRARGISNGIARKQVAVALGSMSDDPSTWNTLCAGKGFYDEKNAVAF